MKDETFLGQSWVVSDDHSLKCFLKFAEEQYREHGYVQFNWQTGTQRTKKQNAAMWLWLDRLAKALNEAGWDMKRTLKADVDIPWTKDSAKAHLWDPIQLALTNKDSSKKLGKQEVDSIQETIARHLAKSTGVSVPFPAKHGGSAGDVRGIR